MAKRPRAQALRQQETPVHHHLEILVRTNQVIALTRGINAATPIAIREKNAEHRGFRMVTEHPSRQ
jgi:hypothetical protein